MPLKILLLGKASKSKKYISINKEDLNANISLLNLLRKYNIPIASSCDGDGVCKKCVINEDQLSCQEYITNNYLNDNIIEIRVEYL